MTTPRNTLLLPTAPLADGDVETTWRLLQIVERSRKYEIGLMLLLFGGSKALNAGSRAAHAQRLEWLRSEYGDRPLIVMLSNRPIGAGGLDLYHHPEESLAYIQAGIDFARELDLSRGRRIVTFHLNSLVSVEEFKRRTAAEWRTGEFAAQVAPVLREVAKYAERRGIEAKVETTPVPEFGDLHDEECLDDLRNPFYIAHHWGFREIRQCGLGICLDLSHSRVLYATARSQDRTSLFEEEAEIELLQRRSLMDDVLALDASDIVHLNDGAGTYSKGRSVFQEGLALGDGELRELPEIIRVLDQRGIHFVLEVQESSGADGRPDFKNRPWTRRSLQYLL